MTKPQLSHAQPQLPASDVEALAAFYKDKLGFTIDYLYGDPPFYALVSRDGAHLNLRKLSTSVINREAQHQEQLLSAAIPTLNVESLYEEFQKQAVEFFQPLKQQPWNAKDFIIKDPDGNLLCFASPT
ncbi:VOC family protein [Mucisphaera calidilacus]|uniref:Bleomycin resistance protein n=1 Tax=Mucisphaera calidilacus TaxID=2527982 RepID=A0A518BZ65_9BACT|nr:VOC family protein [Mucisphaera calidilacus]QDU72256.1 Bleomycin resistance protein [Mucisphaera calidilacus]